MNIRTFAFVAVLIATALGLGSLQPANDNTDNTDPLAFIAGHWRHTSEDGSFTDEYWFPPHKGSTTGFMRWVAPDGSIRMHELLALSARPDGSIDYTMRHFSGDMMPWKSEIDGPFKGVVQEPADGKFVIRCTERNGSVDTITYEQSSEKALRVTLKFNHDAEREPLVFDFTRVK